MTDEESGRNAQDHSAGEPIFLDRFEADGRSSDEKPLMNALPLLREALVALKDLARDGKTRTINIHDIPLTPADTRLMDRVLGAGKVTVQLSSMGSSEWRETRFPGLWRCVHKNFMGTSLLETLEICPFPELAKAEPVDIADGVREMENTLSAATESGAGQDGRP